MQTTTLERTQQSHTTTKPVRTLKIEAASRKEMSLVSHMIRTSADMYAQFVAEEDMDEHYVGAEWEEKNFHQRDFYLGYNAEGDAVGTLSLQYFGDYVYIGYLYLDTKYMGNGYGRRFLDFAREKVAKNNKKGMYLIAHPEATWAVRAYEKYGFKEEASRKEDILAWNQGCLNGYHEEGFNLFVYRP